MVYVSGLHSPLPFLQADLPPRFISIDCDALTDIPSSAWTPVGVSAETALNLIEQSIVSEQCSY